MDTDITKVTDMLTDIIRLVTIFTIPILALSFISRILQMVTGSDIVESMEKVAEQISKDQQNQQESVQEDNATEWTCPYCDGVNAEDARNCVFCGANKRFIMKWNTDEKKEIPGKMGW